MTMATYRINQALTRSARIQSLDSLRQQVDGTATYIAATLQTIDGSHVHVQASLQGPPWMGCLTPVRSAKMSDSQTPPALFTILDQQYGFTLDARASFLNPKCDRHFTRKQDSLKQSWVGERVWLNPPYGRIIGDWLEKVATEP